MKKKNFVSMIMGTIGGIFLGLGMCMCLLPAWGVFTQGVVVACIGLVLLLAMLIVRRKMEGKPAIQLNGKVIGITILGIIGALALGVGMCMTMVWSGLMIPGIIVGVIGILFMMCLIPMVKGLR
ncbi:MAG: hypothetical protein ACK5LX_06935 [Oscillospiraceae bacterium]